MVPHGHEGEERNGRGGNGRERVAMISLKSGYIEPSTSFTHRRGGIGAVKRRHEGCYRARHVPQTHRPIGICVAKDS